MLGGGGLCYEVLQLCTLQRQGMCTHHLQTPEPRLSPWAASTDSQMMTRDAQQVSHGIASVVSNIRLSVSAANTRSNSMIHRNQATTFKELQVTRRHKSTAACVDKGVMAAKDARGLTCSSCWVMSGKRMRGSSCSTSSKFLAGV